MAMATTMTTTMAMAECRHRNADLARPRLRRRSVLSCASVGHSEEWKDGPFEEGPLKQPRYTGQEPLSKLVSGIISCKPLFGLMSAAARRVFIRTAEKKGLPWTEMSQEILSSSNVHKEKELLENKSIVYPEYYLQRFHGYSEGNLTWQAASEAEVATMAMVGRAIPSAQSIEEATGVLRGNWLKAIAEHHEKFSDLPINEVLDIGCSVGMSTICLAEAFSDAQVTGLDLSPYFLAVAQYKEKQRFERSSLNRKPIRWIHANGEDTGLPDDSFDIVSLAYVFHECPKDAIRGLLKESYRMLKPEGTIAITDNSPKSRILQSLPPGLFTLLKSTEPWLDEYYSLDLEQTLSDIGFVNVKSKLTDPRHKTATATVPRVK